MRNGSIFERSGVDSVAGIDFAVSCGIDRCYTAYASGTQLATEGTYSFYAIDKAGNQTAVVSITLDKSKPTGTIYGGSSTLNSGSYTRGLTEGRVDAIIQSND